MAGARDWIHAARPKTLGAAVAPVVVGSVLGWQLGAAFSGYLFACTLLSTLCLQVATNFFNDALDHVKGADTAARLGPVRITAAGVSSVRTSMIAAILVLLLAALFALPLFWERGWPILAIGLPSLFFCFGYTGGPVPLAYRGLGELFVILFFGFVAVVGSAFVQSGQWHLEAVVAGWQIGCFSTVLIAINNLRDVAEDRSTGKRTLAVRFGVRFARLEILLLFLLGYLAGLYWWQQGKVNAALLPLIASPLAVWISYAVFKREPGRIYNAFLALSGIHLLLFALLFCLGLVISGVIG